MTQPATVPPPYPAKKAAPPGGGGSTASESSSVKETIESILIAFILAFIFRAFVVEAFVIPTGSMATTLLGAHMRFTCRECGYVFDVSFQNNRANSGDDIDIPSRFGPEYVKGRNGELEAVHKTVDAYCPNCRFKVPAPDCVD